MKKIIHRRTKETWVKASEIMRVTGWSKMDMFRARNYGWITWKKDNGFWYDLSSVPQELIKKRKHPSEK